MYCGRDGNADDPQRPQSIGVVILSRDDDTMMFGVGMIVLGVALTFIMTIVLVVA
jgi:hypothetical protein